MKVLMTVESMFGNTMRAAEAIASGLSSDYEVRIVPASEATPQLFETADLVIVGAPTHAHGLSRPGTRAQALGRDARAQRGGAAGVRELLDALPRGRGKPGAAFDTRLRGPRWLWGAAAWRIAAALRGAGYKLVVTPMSFSVYGSRGPLVDGEVERAVAWGRALAAQTKSSAARAAA
jgi:Flavodoxin